MVGEVAQVSSDPGLIPAGFLVVTRQSRMGYREKIRGEQISPRN